MVAAHPQVPLQLPNGNVTAPWAPWVMSPTGGGRVQTAGYVERHGAFDFATVKGAGHEAPGFQPLASLQLLRHFLADDMETAILRKPAPAPLAHTVAGRTQGAILAAAVAATPKSVPLLKPKTDDQP